MGLVVWEHETIHALMNANFVNPWAVGWTLKGGRDQRKLEVGFSMLNQDPLLYRLLQQTAVNQACVLATFFLFEGHVTPRMLTCTCVSVEVVCESLCEVLYG